MIAVGDVNRAPAPQPPLVAVIEELQAMQIVQIPGNRSVLAVDLERVGRLVPARIARRLEGRERAVCEARVEGARVIDANPFDLPVKLCISLTKVSVVAVTVSMRPLSRMDVSMQWARRSPETPLPATSRSSRRSPAPPCGTSFEIVQSCRNLARSWKILPRRPPRQGASPVSRPARGDNCTRPYWARRPPRPWRTCARIWRCCAQAASRTSPSCRPQPRRWRSPHACRSERQCR